MSEKMTLEKWTELVMDSAEKYGLPPVTESMQKYLDEPVSYVFDPNKSIWEVCDD